MLGGTSTTYNTPYCYVVTAHSQSQNWTPLCRPIGLICCLYQENIPNRQRVRTETGTLHAAFIMIWLWLILSVIDFISSREDSFLGCYNSRLSIRTYSVPQHTTIEQCIQECKLKYYRYSLRKESGLCFCSNYLGLGEEVNSTSVEMCSVYCPNCDLKVNLTDVYSTGNVVPGPPRNVQITNVTQSSAHMEWREPESFTTLVGYQIKAMVLNTYSSYVTISPEWMYSSDTFQTELVTLLAATKYNITIRAMSPDGLGAVISKLIETKIGDFDNLPDHPQVVKRDNSKIEIKMMPVTNNNGPVTSYLIVVVNEDVKQAFQEETLKSYDDARKEGIFYYIAAEINPKDISKNFIVGDGRHYGKYFNAPLDTKTNYNVLLGAVSSLNGEVKRAFSELTTHSQNRILLIDQPYEEIEGDSPAVIIGLSIAIGLMSFLLVAGIVGFIILKSRVTTRRQRLSDNQELTLQGPMIEVENNGYIPEEEPSKSYHYRNLKQKLRTIPYSQLKIEPTNLLGIGRFGRVNSGSVYEDTTLVPVATYGICDKKLGSENKKNMLMELDLLIRSGSHPNVISLLGTCETQSMLFVVIEYVSMNLKDLLLGSRDSLPGRFSNMSEIQAIDIATNIAKGMAHLHSNKIIHKQLCARNIMVANGFIPKISGYGLAQYYSHNNLPDYTRWTALEVFKGQQHNAKSDVWSFACLLWEICVLGGTPYGNFLNNEIHDKVIKGLRLPQMQYFSDSLYQIMLNCWQIDMDERPNFGHLIESLEDLKGDTLIPHLNFNLYPSFQYEQFYPDMEVAVRPVF